MKETKREQMERESEELADYMIRFHESTISDLSQRFAIPRTTIHRRLTHTLAFVDLDKWRVCQRIFEKHRLNALEHARDVAKKNRERTR